MEKSRANGIHAKEVEKSTANGIHAKEMKSKANGIHANNTDVDSRTDHTRWRLKDDRGAQTWHYLDSDDELEKWPQSIADKYHLGLPTNLPDLPPAKTPLECARNGLTFFEQLQLPSGHWACEYGGPMFLLPGVVIAWYVTGTPIPDAYRREIRNYLYARQNKHDGGWGLHIEGHSSVFGCAMNYVTLRICGASAEDPRMVKARGTLHKLGGAASGPHWTKWWLSVLGVAEWEIVNPVPPELWLLPDWAPIAPWRWWVHIRYVYLPMSLAWSRRWSMPPNDFTRELRAELYTQPYESINWAGHRNSIAKEDNYQPKHWILNTLNWLLVMIWIPFLRTDWLVQRAENWVWTLIKGEDENSDYADLAPVNGAMNLVACHIVDGPDAYSVRRHRERIWEYLWMKDEGVLCNGTNGVQSWDTAFLIQAAVECGFATDPRWKPCLTKALGFMEDQQMRENATGADQPYRQKRKGAWGFSTKLQGYTVSDCTSEGAKAVMMLQSAPGYPKLISDARLRDAIDIILTMQNPSGGCASYEPTRGSLYLEYLSAAEVFGNIMIEYDYPECTTACVIALSHFRSLYPSYRAAEITAFVARAVQYIRRAQRPDGSWYGSWGICFTYAGMFALESLKSVGEVYSNSARVQRACRFFTDRQFADGGWGESYKSCEDQVWTPHPDGSQVVQTAWVVIALLEAGFPDQEPLRRAVRLLVRRQRANGEWAQEGIEGVFNKSCMISYPNYKFIFPIKALGMYAARYGDDAVV
ncbi:lanosterol synthase [Pseudovirgaria hyperparasitica]|uniref:Terpene cyclase/mutase family member n=1 Tax=Pseudovirgaria hyperparasitica TaxID=470096 RepID=A0A6A6W009_9PEZI|nr:lanosterol synthase [Pseudovirgaria hyperparasitica]KAF2754907.1 lanosterol synthase [Pseudovirgaria hyperparasitica]